MQKKVVNLRDKQHLAWDRIKLKVRNLQKNHPSRQHVIEIYNSFSTRACPSPKKDKYNRCGRRAWKMTSPVKAFLVRRLLALRAKCICTSATLQEELTK
eukprot:711996-Karenia_brevis.AAC.1